MRYVVGLIAVLFGCYAGWESYTIAVVGVENQIPQLQGDGGGGMLFAALCVVSGLLALLYPVASIITFLLAALLTIFVGAIYQDNVMDLWSIAPFALALASGVAVWRAKQRAPGSHNRRMALFPVARWFRTKG